MGDAQYRDMMFRSIVVAIALIAAAHAAPTTNDVVPETNFVEGAATSAHASAKQIATEMIQAGSDWTACSELANATRDEITDAVAAKQDMLDGLDKGCDCAGKGQDEVIRTLDEMNAASSAVKVAETALETASNTQVQLADQEFSFLQSGECGWIQTDASYQTAHVTYTKAVNTLATERITYKLSVTAHTEAVIEAARLKLECECATQSAHAVAWADANQDNDANAAAWAQAHHIDCVVDHIAEADCSFGPAPGLTQPTLCDDIESVSCATESGSAAPTVVSESAYDLGTEAWPAGFCLSHGSDQNNGVTKLEGGNYEGNTKEAQCLAQCKEHSADWTGCEVIWDQGNAGCYVHTEHVDSANSVARHKCLLREVYDTDADDTAPVDTAPTGPTWVKGANGANCDDTCSALDKTCDTSYMDALTTADLVTAAFAEAGYTCINVGGSRNYPGSPFSTSRNGDDCYFTTPGSNVVSNGNSYGHHAALCSCV